MNNLLKIHIESKSFHHGYLLAGDPAISRGMAFEAAKKILNSTTVVEGNPDFFYQKFDLFGIDNSHELRRMASQRPFTGDNKVFVIEITSFSIESANALLKLFEEPYGGTYFFVIVPSLEDVIPTLRSRLTVIKNLPENKFYPVRNVISNGIYEKFLKDLPNKRLESIKNILKDRKEAINFLNELEVVLLGILGSPASKWKQDFQVLEQIQKCRDFLFQKGSSAKMILEHIALTLPQIV
jgi:DNA polymerase III delta prime subunit